MKEAKTKILLFDIENAPSLGWVWGKYEQDVIDFDNEWYMLTFSAKWMGQKRTYVYGLPDFALYKKEPENDLELLKVLWRYLDEADILIAHNGDKFDVRKTNARFLYHNIDPPTPYKTIDTLKIARKYFMLNSNKLNDIAKYLKIGQKVQTGGFELWKGCMLGDEKSWNKMKRYNKQDVILLEKVYLKLIKWAETRATTQPKRCNGKTCPECTSPRIAKWGRRPTMTGYVQLYRCRDCEVRSSAKAVKAIHN